MTTDVPEIAATIERESEPYWDTVEKTMNPLMGTITLLREATAEDFASPAYISKSQEALDYAVAGMAMLDPNGPDAKALSVAILKLARFLSLDWSTYNEADIPEVHNQNWLTSLTASGCMPCQLAAQEEAARAEKERDPDEEYPATARWEGVIGYENQMTGDGRFLEEGSLRWENLPIVMRYVSQDVGAHDGAQVVANIDKITRLKAEEDGSIPLWGEGEFDLGSPVGREAYRQVKGGWTTGVSMDLDDVTFEVHASRDLVDEAVMGNAPEMADMEEDEHGRLIAAVYAPDDEVAVTTDGRIRAATIVAIPAFEGARISLAADIPEALAASGGPSADFQKAGEALSAGFARGLARGLSEFGGPNQARAPEGTSKGGQWMDTPSGLLSRAQSSTPAATGGDEREVVVNGNTFRGSIAPDHPHVKQLQDMGASTPPLVRVENADADSAAAFRDALISSKEGNKFGSSVDVHDSYEGNTLYLTEDGLSGIALEADGNIASGFSHPSSPNRGFVQHALASAVADGGTHLDCYDTVLPKLYSSAGFEAKARLPWNDEYAPPDWDYATYKKYNDGRPDVVFMEYTGKMFGQYTPGSGETVEDYDEGLGLVTSENALATEEDGLVDFVVGPVGDADSGALLVGEFGVGDSAHEIEPVLLGKVSHPSMVRPRVNLVSMKETP